MNSHVRLLKTGCCGIAEIESLCTAKTPLEALLRLEHELRRGIVWRDSPVGRGYPLITFTGIPRHPDKPSARGYCEELEAFIVKHDLGPVRSNPNPKMNWTGNMIRLWVWEPDYNKLWAILDAAKIVAATTSQSSSG